MNRTEKWFSITASIRNHPAPRSGFEGIKRPRINSGSERADSRIRTDDLIITNDLLYQLSYIGVMG